VRLLADPAEALSGLYVASLRFALAEESKLLLNRLGRSSASAKSARWDLPTGSVVGHTHLSTTIKRRQDNQIADLRGPWQQDAVCMPGPAVHREC
jgi:hypothetical protein